MVKFSKVGKMKRKDNKMMIIALTLLLHVMLNPATSCDKADYDSLTSFLSRISPKPSLNWTSSSNDCCKWEGVSCNANNSQGPRVTGLSLPGRGISGSITPFIGNLTHLSHLNLSRNRISGHLPEDLFETLPYLQVLDLSSNQLTGPLMNTSLPPSISAVDLSDNSFNGSIEPSFFLRASKISYFNLSSNLFTGPLPSSICENSRFVEILDFSYNEFNGQVSRGLGSCLNLKSLRAGFNALTGPLPRDLYGVKTLKEVSFPNNLLSGHVDEGIVRLSNLTLLELHENDFAGKIPKNIGNFTNLEHLLLHTNNLISTLPPSLTRCTNLTTLLLRNNRFTGEISALDFSKLRKLRTVDFGNNSFSGRIPRTLCTCRSLRALRLAHNKLTGQIPRCMASLTSLEHLSVTNNSLKNVTGALKILKRCENLTVLLMSRCFHGEKLPDDDDMAGGLGGFHNLQMFTLGGCGLTGQIPSWISRLGRLKVLNLSYNLITGRVPPWLGDMESLSVLNLTQNHLSGTLPREIGRLRALTSGDSSTELSYLALPFLFRDQEYKRIFSLARGLKLSNNRLTGRIPEEIGGLRLLQVLELSSNRFEGSIPDGFSKLVNLEKLDLANNGLSGEIPSSLAGLSFLSQFFVGNNNLEGEIPRGGQLDTFPASSFEGNPKLCGAVLGRRCGDTRTRVEEIESGEDGDVSESFFLPFGVAYVVSFFVAFVWRFTVCKRGRH